jgi:hypothetical protein
VEGIRDAPAVGRRVRERFDYLEELDDGARPAVRHEQRHGLLMRRADVRELDVQPVDLGDELRQLVERRLDLAPVVVCAPILDERLELGQLDTLGPVADGLLVRPPCRRHAPAEVEEIPFRNVDPEGSDRDPFPNLTGHSGFLSADRASIYANQAMVEGSAHEVRLTPHSD